MGPSAAAGPARREEAAWVDGNLLHPTPLPIHSLLPLHHSQAVKKTAWDQAWDSHYEIDFGQVRTPLHERVASLESS